jgi:predicted nucleotidyltransferase
MRIDPRQKVGKYPAILVRTTLRRLRQRLQWGLADLEEAAALAPGNGRALVKALRTEGLIEPAGRGVWTVNQVGRTFSVATAAKPVTRVTAEKALVQFLERVARVNEDPYFLARVTKVVLFGSMLKPEVERLSDVDLAVQLAQKETDVDRAREQSLKRAEEMAIMGHRFRHFLEMEGCWYLETFRFLKGRSRVIALADYDVEKSLVIAVPHRMLIGEPEQLTVDPALIAPKAVARKRRRGDFPF